MSTSEVSSITEVSPIFLASEPINEQINQNRSGFSKEKLKISWPNPRVRSNNLNLLPINERLPPANLTQTSLSTTNPTANPLTLKITKKAKNSPILSIQKFINHHLIYQSSTTLISHKLWTKYQLDDQHSVIIKEHDLDFMKFKEIADPILETVKSHHIEVTPLFCRSNTTDKLNNLIFFSKVI